MQVQRSEATWAHGHARTQYRGHVRRYATGAIHRPSPVCVAADKLAPPKLRRFHVLPCVSIRAHFNHGVDDLPPDAVSPLRRDVDVFAACAIVQDICTAVRASANGQIQSIAVSYRAGSPHTSTHSAHEHLYAPGNMRSRPPFRVKYGPFLICKREAQIRRTQGLGGRHENGRAGEPTCSSNGFKNCGQY